MAAGDRVDMAYGPHDAQRLDFFPATVQPAPVVVHIHGGGWTGGNKSAPTGEWCDRVRAAGFAFASVAYRLTPEHPLPAPVHDAARAIQYLRLHADELGIDAARIGLFGPSAGACSSLWLALHPDLADPDSDDPVLRQSTRPACCVARSGQTCLQPEVARDWIGDEVLRHRMIWKAVGADSLAELESGPPSYGQTLRAFSPITHASAAAPPILLEYDDRGPLPATDAGRAIHHVEFGRRLKAELDAHGADCRLLYPRDADAGVGPAIAFFREHLQPGSG
jgi:acetyl esterase/lipase